MEELSRAIPKLIMSFSSVERLLELENLAIENKSMIIERNIGIPVGIEMKNITFAYNESNILMKNQTIIINPGDTIAIVGHSGSGKTTMIRMLLSLLYPQSGNITLFTLNQKRIVLSESTRNYFSYVPQGNALFSGSIAENLRIADINASDSKLVEVLNISCAWDFIRNSKDGLETKLGEGGMGLSEGQIQRISIARALLKEAPILLLDEATSALDMETENRLISNIKKFNPDLTCIAITHRLSILDICDSVYRLENGCFTIESKDFTQPIQV